MLEPVEVGAGPMSTFVNGSMMRLPEIVGLADGDREM
jgi:hypothetical protein